MANTKESNIAKVKTVCKDEPTHEERILNALSADELEVLFQEKEPGLITVLGKFRVTPMLYQLVAAQLESIEINLISGIEYTPAELIGDSDWAMFEQDGQREMELCLKQFALNDMCPLVDTGTGTFLYV